MTETSGSETGGKHAGDVGAHRATVGDATDEMSVNVPPTRPEALENALEEQAAREEHETFVSLPPSPDDRIETPKQEEEEETVSTNNLGDQSRAGVGDPSRTAGLGVGDPSSRTAGVGESAPPVTAASDEGQAREQIQQTREQVGATVEALAGKMDVKQRLQDVTPEKVVEEAKKRPKLLMAAAGVVAMLVVRRLMRRGKK